MELKEGYKNTEVGIIPNDWNTPELGDVLKIRHGKSQKGIEDNNGKYPILGTGGLMGYTNTFIYNKESVLIGRKGTIDKPQFMSTPFWTVDTLFYSEVKVEKALPKYLYYYFFQIDWYSYNEASGVPSLNGSKIEKIKIPLPPTLEEQQAIATALSDIDTLITNLDKLIAKKKAIKQGAMQQLLKSPDKGGKRLPGFEGEWITDSISNIMKIFRGGSPRPIQDYLTQSQDGINWIKIGDTDKFGKYIKSSVERIIPEGQNFSRKVNIGDFLLSNSMSFGRPYILKINGCIHDGWLVLQNYQSSLDTEFLYYLLISREVHNQYLSKAAGSGVLNLNKELVKSVELTFPKSLKEQKSIASVFCDMDTEIKSLESKKSKYLLIKQGMMQELLTGKTRLI